MKIAPLVIIICLLMVIILSTFVFKYNYATNNNPDYSITLVSYIRAGLFKKGNIVYYEGDTIGYIDSICNQNKYLNIRLRIKGKYNIPDSSAFYGSRNQNTYSICLHFSKCKTTIKPNAIIDDRHHVVLDAFLVRL
jgi:hypothetical protein